ncbi:MAG: tRNA pseudouridine(13) synthase TruD [Planctomycetota bacterium]
MPYLTAGLPGVGGAIKRYDEDFLVEELPLYLPSGEGTHTYFGIEKRGLTTLAATAAVAKALGKRAHDIGYAGLKDAHALTRQTFSVEHVTSKQIEALDLARIKVLWISLHRNKLKLGHLRGNRFVLKIRAVGPEATARARTIIDVLHRRGVPNYFGPQRFGTRGDNAEIGRAVLKDDFDEALRVMLGRPGPLDRDNIRRARELFEQGRHEEAARAWPEAFREQIRVCRALARADGDARRAWSAVNHTLRKLYVSAEQSRLFNLVLAERLEGIDRVEVGDMAWKHVNGACFRVEDLAAEQPRCVAFEISPTGPLYGARMTEATGRPGELEAEVLAREGLESVALRRRGGVKLDGARRPLRVPLGDQAASAGEDDHGPYLQVSFTLPPGSYATCITREICKEARSTVSPGL